MGCGAYTFLIFGLQHLQLADMTVFTFLAPVFVAIASPYLLNEALMPGTWETCVVCFLSVILVAQPSSLFGHMRISIVSLSFGLLHPLCSAIAKASVRLLCATEATSVIMSYLASFSIVCSGLGMLLVPNQYVHLKSWQEWLLVGTIGA